MGLKLNHSHKKIFGFVEKARKRNLRRQLSQASMVYTELHVVSGLLLSRDQIINALNAVAEVKFDDIEEEEALLDFFKEDLIKMEGGDLWKKNGGSYPELIPFVCCSGSRNKWFILGFRVHTYYRRHIQCRDCGEYTVCDRCIGETSNGWYDVNKIFEEPVLIPREKMCNYCHSDQVDVNHRCKCCFRVNTEADQKRLSYQEERINRFAKEILHLTPETYAVSHYYMVNDCLSCT